MTIYNVILVIVDYSEWGSHIIAYVRFDVDVGFIRKIISLGRPHVYKNIHRIDPLLF